VFVVVCMCVCRSAPVWCRVAQGKGEKLGDLSSVVSYSRKIEKELWKKIHRLLFPGKVSSAVVVHCFLFIFVEYFFFDCDEFTCMLHWCVCVCVCVCVCKCVCLCVCVCVSV
jgi:hypothetical protein